jgi:hypothetical protein
MSVAASISIFLDFNLPNATTWFYFSLLLAIALFLKFTRLLSVRNWDVLTLFLLVPGLLLLQEAHTRGARAEDNGQLPASPIMAGDPHALASPSLSTSLGSGDGDSDTQPPDPRFLFWGYLWLLCGSGYFLARCFVDLALVRRPALSPNLNLAGLAWLAAALFVCLVAVALRRPENPPGSVGKRSAAVNETQQRMVYLFKQVPSRASLRGAKDDRTAAVRFWVESLSAIVCHLAIVIGLTVIGWRHFQDAHSGVAAATFYLLLPYTAYHVDQMHHVLPTAFLVWAIAAYRRPVAAGLLLGLATLTGYFPALLFPAWLSFYWAARSGVMSSRVVTGEWSTPSSPLTTHHSPGTDSGGATPAGTVNRGAGRFAGAFVLVLGIGLAVVLGILWLEGDLASNIRSTLALSEWQPWQQPSPLTRGFWTGVRWAGAYRMPVFIAYLAFVGVTLFWPAPKNLAHLVALSAAVVIGIQFWFADQGGVYVLWYLPLLLLLVFRPNLADRTAPPIKPEGDWLARWRTAFARFGSRLLRQPQPIGKSPLSVSS